MGCLATPAIDSTNGWVFALCSANNTSWVLYKVSLSSGSILAQQTISASSQGVTFSYSTAYAARPGLAIANGNVYTSHGQADSGTWYGWELAYSESSLTQVGVFLVAPSGGGSIWQSGGGPAVDSNGNVYVTTGNGTTYDGTSNFIMSCLKLSSTLSLVDWYTPTNWSTLNAADADLSSGPPFLVDSTHVAFGVKDWNVYVVNTNCMGHLGGTVGCTAPQVFPMPNQGTVGANSGIFGRMFMNGVGYFPTAGGVMYGFSFSGGAFNTTPLFATTNTYNTHGLMMAGSSNGASGNIVWGLSPNGNNYSTAFPATLRAINATTGAELWNSGTKASDNLTNTAKFITPLIANGRVYVGEQNAVAVFGILNSSALRGQATARGKASIH